jgi:uncharacterized protein YkwD
MRRTKYVEKWVKIGFIVVTIVIVFALIMVLVGSIQLQLSIAPSPQSTAPILSLSPSVSPSTFSSLIPTISPSTIISNAPSSIPISSSPSQLVNYALSLINSDRQLNGLQNVTLSSIDSAQQHADNMLKNGYFSHWDTNGYKPYMRYTLAGGQGAVAENIAWRKETGNIFGTDVKSALKDLEWSMMYDDAASNWGHRDNILNPLHNKVSIGIAYDEHNVYFVEDFEDDYINWITLSVSGSTVQMQGTILKLSESISNFNIYFDNLNALTTQQLANSPYNSSYDSGTYVGNIQAPPESGYYYEQPTDHVLIVASTWKISGSNFEIAFDISQAFNQNGKGVYTLYLWTKENICLTTFSIWNK